MDGRTEGCTDGYLRPTLLGRLEGVDLKIRLFVGDLASLNGKALLDAIFQTVTDTFSAF